MKGKVYLVGAGPGDPGLLTVKALRLIREADLIVYDTLANPEHLRWAKEGAKKICVGKGFRHRPMSQDRINRLIIEAARKGRKVVRLKGGDPFLFGRGGEEALVLVRHRVPFEAVPGVTSAAACAAYAGIPLTHRDHNASVTFLTGHRADDEDLSSVDWKSLVRLGGTLVVYMGFYNLGKIVRRLVENGMPSDMEAAVIHWGTLPYQKSCAGTLADIEPKVKKAGLKAPCIILVGKVVRLKNKLNWFEGLPLFGKTVAVTRMRDRAGVLKDRLEELGARVIEFPVIEIKKPASAAEIDRAIVCLSCYDWLVFTSAYGVESFFERLAKLGKDARALGLVKVAAVGPETGRALAERGVVPDLLPERFETEALAEEFGKRFSSLEEVKILLLRSDIAPPFLEERLRKMGAEVTRITAYQTALPKLSLSDGNLFREKVDFVTFTSASTVIHFLKVLGRSRARKILRKAKIASIGPVTSRTLRRFGFEPHCQARTFTIEGLVQSMRSLPR
ncbi:MAG: uroporphyrinogen-III C-methyltransferase [Candidatus Omnitrophica bacterium]|nr:uroporphyrinogen-III C-methyltransferase [Candidatus Omnitrophota bacterium]